MQAHCERCDATVQGSYRHPKMRRIAWGYLAIVIPIVPILPMAASDFVVAIPTMMLYMLGLGPVFAIIREPAVCSECDAFLPKKRAHST